MRGRGFGRLHVLRRVLQGVGVHGQTVYTEEFGLTELPPNDLLEERVTRRSVFHPDRATFRTRHASAQPGRQSGCRRAYGTSNSNVGISTTSSFRRAANIAVVLPALHAALL